MPEMTVSDAKRRYLDDAVRSWLGVHAGAAAGLPTLPEDLARRLLREEEYEHEYRDRRGRFEFAAAESYAEGTLLVPSVDVWAAEQRSRIKGQTDLQPLWPRGHSFVMCLTHDVDYISPQFTPKQVARLVRSGLAPTPWASHDSLRRSVRLPWRVLQGLMGGVRRAPSADALERCVGIERDAGVTATYFFTTFPRDRLGTHDCIYRPNDACVFHGKRQRVADVMKELAADGFDIGLHGSYHSALEPGMLMAQRAEIEDATGLTLATTRQHYLHWNVRVTPRMQESAGFRADSTVGFNRSLGLRAGTALPYRLFDLDEGRTLDLIEVPLAVHDVALFRPDSLDLDFDLANRIVRRFIGAIAETGGVATISFHPNNVDRSRFVDLYRSVIDYGVERGAWFASVAQVDAWWREREEGLMAASP